MAATVELIYRTTEGVRRQTKPYRRAATTQDLAEWIEDYLADVDAGYRPPGHPEPPRPHCARVLQAGRVVAEWIAR